MTTLGTPDSSSGAAPTRPAWHLPSVAKWWTSDVVYQIYPRSFQDSNGDGIGDLPGILARLDYLDELGIDVIWLSPIYPSPHDDNGYDVSDYQNVDPIFGTLDDFDALLAAIHERGMKLMLDIVVNHTSDEHPWFIESRSSISNPKRDWYIWKDPVEGQRPNNWESFFSGSVWELDPTTGQYYLHLFSKKQPDLNWANPEVREAIHAMMRWWLDRGVDGFRMDVINFLSKDPDFPNAPDPDGRGTVDGSRYFNAGPRIHEYLHEMHEEVFSSGSRGLLTVGEMPGVTIGEAQKFTDPSRAELDMVFQFEHVGLDQGETKWEPAALRLVDLKRSLAAWQGALRDVGWNSLYWNNHDQPRAVSRFGDDGENHHARAAKLLATVLHLHRGTPFIYQGEEIGMTNAALSDISQVRDVESLNFYADSTKRLGMDPATAMRAIRRVGRDNARTPMQWTAGEHAGFTTADPWIDVNGNYRILNAEAERADPQSVFHYYRRLIELRHTDPIVESGSYQLLYPDHDHLFCFIRTSHEGELLVAANFCGERTRLPHDLRRAWSDADFVIGNVEQSGAPLPSRLEPWQAVVLRRSS